MGAFVVLLLFLVASETTFSEDQDLSALARMIKIVGTDGHRKAAAEGYSNCFISPLDLAIAFGMFYDVIRDKIPDEVRSVFGYGKLGLTDSEAHAAFKRLREIIIELSEESKEYVMHQIVAVLIQKNYPIVQRHKHHLRQNYIATSVDVDFQKGDVKTVQEINDCVKFKTNTEIEKPRVDFDLLPHMVLLNGGCFQGTWKTECDPEDTSEEVFYNRGSYREKTKVEMIHFEGEFLCARLDEGTVLELPFKGDDVSLIVYLPDTLNGAYEAEQKLQADDLIVALKQAKKCRLNVSFPIFKLEYNTTSKCLPVNTPDNTFACQVYHKAFMGTDRKGLEAAGLAEVVTGTRIRRGGHIAAHKAPAEANEEGSEPPEVTRMQTETTTEDEIENMIFDHPFLFVLCDGNHVFVYLEGRVCDL